MTLLTRIVLVCSVFVLFAVSLFAQAAATLHGQVLDPSGAAVPGASITLTGPNTLVKVAQSDVTGSYVILGLPPGQYTVRVAAKGFSLFQRVISDLPAGKPSTLDVKLSVANDQQEVTVTETQQVALDPSANAGALVLKEADLDMLSDDPDDLQADLLALAGPAAGPNGGQIFVDGFSNGQLPPKDSIREIRINSNPFSSEFDRPGFGRIEILTKPGSDKFRGTVQLNYGDSIWNSRNPYSSNKPFYDTRNLNANLSGPLSKKASFFVDFSRRDMRDSSLINAQIVDPNTFLVSTLNQSIPVPSLRTSVSPRIDYQLTPNITLQGRYTWIGNDLSNQGVGGINLPDTAYTSNTSSQQVQLTETWVANARTINETRFQLFRQRQDQNGVNPVLNIEVNDEFASGSSFPLNYQNRSDNEFQNYTSITRGPQFIKFGVRIRGAIQDNYSTTNYTGQFVFNSLNAYLTTLQGRAQGLSAAQIAALGGGPSQYIVAGGKPLVGGNQVDAGLFFQDDYKVLPSMTLSLGMRYELQNNIGDKADWAPRLGLAWGIGKGQGRLRQPKTVLRLGYGWFYDRFSINNTLQAERFNGINQLQYIVPNPAFFPQALPPDQLTGFSQSQNTYLVDSNLRSPLLEQSAIGFDRQLPKNISFSFNYVHSRGLRQLRTVDINTPLPGTYSGPGTGFYPYGPTAGVLDLYETSGNLKQNQLIFNVNARINSKISLFGFYVYGSAHSDVLAQPSNPYNFAADWGRAAFDIRNRVNINGNIALPFGMRLAPNISANSAPPFNITQGIDQFGDTLFNSRPAFVPAGFSGPACTAQLAASRTTCLATTPQFGSFIVNPTPGMKIIPANYGNAFSQFTINARLSRTWGWGEPVTGPQNGGRRGGGGGGGRGPGFGGFRGGGPGGGGPPPGGGGGFFGGGDGSGKRYTVTAGIFVRNLLNTWNPGPPEGNLLSPRFGESLALAGGAFGGPGGATQSANRRIELSLRFTF